MNISCPPDAQEAGCFHATSHHYFSPTGSIAAAQSSRVLLVNHCAVVGKRAFSVQLEAKTLVAAGLEEKLKK